jgi:hypothetical protein
MDKFVHLLTPSTTQTPTKEKQTMNIPRNKDGRHNLTALRQAVEATPNVSVRPQGDGWIVATLIGDIWHETPAPYHYGEREALQKALGMDVDYERHLAEYTTR